MGLFGGSPFSNRDMPPTNRGGLFGGRGGMGRPSMMTLLATGAITYLASHPQAFRNLLGRAQSRGLGRKVDSWVGTGPNEPLRPEEVDNVIEPHEIDQIARQAGVSREEARQVLAQVVPNMVDKLTPHGEVPPPNILQQGLNFLRDSIRPH